MATSGNKRQEVTNIKINPKARCLRIYPVEDKRNRTETIANLKTVGLVLSREQAVHFARLLLMAAQEWTKIDITAFRKPRLDGTYDVTVTHL